MTARKRLSLCMIVNNEEAFIESCLSSARQLVDEIVIVDTGSTDGTQAVCRTFNANVHAFPWNGSFAAARNFGIERATGDWILWLDADEQLEVPDPRLWMDRLEEDERQAWGVPVINYYGDIPLDPNRAYLLAQCRVFRHGRGIRFMYDIHEQLNIRPPFGHADDPVDDDPLLPAVIHHYGYLEPLAVARRKHERNMAMLRKAQAASDYPPMVDYHIAGEYYRMRDYPTAFEQLNTAIRRFLDKGQVPPSLVYKMKYDILLALGSYSGALAGIDKAIALYPDYVDLHYYKGILLLAKGRCDEAEAVFRHCLTLGEGRLHHLTLRGAGSFHALYLIGRCRETAGDREGAMQIYNSVLRQCPDHSEAKQRLAQWHAEPPVDEEPASS